MIDRETDSPEGLPNNDGSHLVMSIYFPKCLAARTGHMKIVELY